MGVTDAANNPTSQLGRLPLQFFYQSNRRNYNYDGNGNLTQDNNKLITSITYNYLNLPQLIHFQGKGKYQLCL